MASTQHLLGERAFAEAMLEVELGLLRALAGAGLAPATAVEELASLVADPKWLDLDQLRRGTAASGTPVPALLAAIRSQLDPDGSAAAHLHRGATSQDIVDSASMLISRRALASLLEDLSRAAEACTHLADAHRDLVMPGRTLLQQGAPITFGLKAAAWLTGLDGTHGRLGWVTENCLAVQLGGAVGTLAALGDRGIQVMEHLAAELDLAVPVATWHTVRDRPAQLACGLGMALGTMGKIAQDVVLLAQNEIGELREAADETRGGSSAMPQKRNPVSAIAVLSCATRGPGLVATVLASMVQEHERAAGRWQAEWETLAELLHLAARAAAATRELLEGLEIDGRRMRANLLPVSMSEAVVAALSRSLDGQQARQIVQDAARAAAGRPGSFREVLLETPEVAQTLGEAGLDRALEPERWLGSTQELIDRALAAHRRPLGW